jgi:asparagine synthase (glutamine-hydrolysing)
MCGIAGVLNLNSHQPVEAETLHKMLALLRHRGPDEFGVYLGQQVGLGHARLSIIDLASGQQPITNEDGTLWIVFNGEIFNYLELRPALEARGHCFTTQTDTEVILHLYEDHGPDCLGYLNGQFAIAIWDERQQTLFLARDRLGVRPLFYTLSNGALIFASEIKAILADRRVQASIDPLALDQIFTYWSTLSPRTIFRDIVEVPPAHYLLARSGDLKLERYWQLQFPVSDQGNGGKPTAYIHRVADYLDEFRQLLVDATRIRLRADVPVGAYLSGGLDSSLTAAIIRNYTPNQLDTFSITFEHPDYDESPYQRKMADLLGTDHHVVHVTNHDISRVFPDVIWHTEVPILRTAPAPLFLLSQLVRERGYKVVVTGEGADEFLAGYNIFKEAKIRRFWARQPESQSRKLLLTKLYPYIRDLSDRGGAYLGAFFGAGLTEVDTPDYSHAIRWRNTARTKRFFSQELQEQLRLENLDGRSIRYPPEFQDWAPLSRAQYLEITIFLSQYLLSSQGDRVAMAHSVEGRFPFLDTRLVEFCNHLPPDLKLLGLTEKVLLKKLARQYIPPEIWQRPKRPYRAPIQKSFFSPRPPAYVPELLSTQWIKASGLFEPNAVEQLQRKAQDGRRLSETDEMALTGILSTQLVYQQFVIDFREPVLNPNDKIKVCNAK